MIPAVLLLLALAPAAGPVHLYRDTPAEHSEARQELITEDPSAFRDAWLAVLADADPDSSPWGPALESAALDTEVHRWRIRHALRRKSKPEYAQSLIQPLSLWPWEA